MNLDLQERTFFYGR